MFNIDKKTLYKTKSFISSTSSSFSNAVEEQSIKAYKYSEEKVLTAYNDYQKSKEPINDNNWYIKAAQSCEELNDAFMREEGGTSSKVTKGVIGKLGATGTSIGIFSIASIIGTASTGTAIGTLSGAAFTSASLAWLGGSILMGSVIIGVASIAGGIGAVLGAGWVFKKYVYGKKRERTELELKEQNIVDVCLSLAAAFRHKAQDGTPIDPLVANAMYTDALQPLCEDLLEYKLDNDSWTSYAKKRFKDSLNSLIEVTNYLKRYSNENPNITTGVFSVVVLQLLGEGEMSFAGDEEIVLEALRRSNNLLSNASNDELSNYVQGLSPEQIAGLTNNIKGIYHELKFAQLENSDGDNYIVELFEDTNHAGADVRIINTLTGDIKEVQLKATDYLSYIQKHNERYEDIEVFATSEVASKSEYITSTEMSNERLTCDVEDTFEKLDSFSQSNLSSSMTVAALISLARNTKTLLRGESLTQSDKEKIIKDGTIAAGTAALVSLLLG